MKNTSSPCSTSVIDDSTNPHRIEISAIISLQNTTKFLSHQHILITRWLITSANPAEPVLLYEPDTPLQFPFCAMKRAANISFCFPGYRKREENRVLLLSKVVNAPQSFWKLSPRPGEDEIKPEGYFQDRQLRTQVLPKPNELQDAVSSRRAQILSSANGHL